MLVDFGFFKTFVDPKLIRRVESRMQDYTEINPPMEIKAMDHNTLFGTAQGILLVVVRDTQDLCRTVKLPLVLVPGLKRNIFSTALAAQKGVKTIFTKAGSIVDLGLFSLQLTRSDDLDHLDLAISNESKRTWSACCAISGKAFGKETTLMASVLQKPIALSSAVCINIDEKVLVNGTVGHNNDIPTYRILYNPTSIRSEVSCCEKNNPPSSVVVDDIDKGSKSSDDLENEYDGIQNEETTGSDSVGDDNGIKKQDGTLILRFIEKKYGDLAGEKTMNCKQPTEKRLGAFASEIVDNTKKMEKTVPPVCRINIKVRATEVASGTMSLKNYTEWLNTIESEQKAQELLIVM